MVDFIQVNIVTINKHSNGTQVPIGNLDSKFSTAANHEMLCILSKSAIIYGFQVLKQNKYSKE